MLNNCFRFAPRDSVPGLIAKICRYLKDHPGWSEEELEDQIKQFIGQTGVESFNGRTGSVVLTKEDVNNLKIASAYFAEGDETIDELNLSALYNQGVRFVFTNWNSVTSAYDLAFVLENFSDSDDVVYYPMSTGSGGGNIVSVNGKTGIVDLSLSDILGDSGAQVKLCTAAEFTSTALATWNAYYEDGYRIVGVVNANATAIDYIYLLKQDANNHQPIGLSVGASDAYTPSNPPPYPVTSVNGKTGEVTIDAYTPSNPPPYPVTSVNGKTGDVTIDGDGVVSGVSTVNGENGDVIVKAIYSPNETVRAFLYNALAGTGRVIATKSTLGDEVIDVNVGVSSDDKIFFNVSRNGVARNQTVYSGFNQPPYPVTSVNSKTGAVNIPVGVENFVKLTGTAAADGTDENGYSYNDYTIPAKSIVNIRDVFRGLNDGQPIYTTVNAAQYFFVEDVSGAGAYVTDGMFLVDHSKNYNTSINSFLLFNMSTGSGQQEVYVGTISDELIQIDRGVNMIVYNNLGVPFTLRVTFPA